MAELSPHAAALADQLRDGDEDSVAVVVILSAAAARGAGQPPAEWMAERAATLTSIGTAVDELRAAGWVLEVENRTRDLPPDAERLVIVSAKEIPDG